MEISLIKQIFIKKIAVFIFPILAKSLKWNNKKTDNLRGPTEFRYVYLTIPDAAF